MHISPTMLLLFETFLGYSAELRAGCSGVRVPAGAGNFSQHPV